MAQKNDYQRICALLQWVGEIDPWWSLFGGLKVSSQINFSGKLLAPNWLSSVLHRRRRKPFLRLRRQRKGNGQNHCPFRPAAAPPPPSTTTPWKVHWSLTRTITFTDIIRFWEASTPVPVGKGKHYKRRIFTYSLRIYSRHSDTFFQEFTLIVQSVSQI